MHYEKLHCQMLTEASYDVLRKTPGSTAVTDARSVCTVTILEK